jgi:ribonuclease J
MNQNNNNTAATPTSGRQPRKRQYGAFANGGNSASTSANGTTNGTNSRSSYPRRENNNGSRGSYGNNNRNSGRRSTSGGGNSRSWGRGNQNDYSSKTEISAQATAQPYFVPRKVDTEAAKKSLESALKNVKQVKNIRSTSLPKGNLAATHLNPQLSNGVHMISNSPKTFPEGPNVRLIPIGGVNEVGMNMTAIECGDDIIVIDTGFGFGGGERFPGVDYLIPDTAYLEENLHKVKGIIYTHGHLDHIGGAPYILPKLKNVPIYTMPLTLALLKNRLEEFNLQNEFDYRIIDVAEQLVIGVFKIDLFRLNHSIPDVIGLGIDTPKGRIVYTTDWKFDNTPYDGMPSDYGKIAYLGDKGVRLLLTDSLGILKPGYAISEKTIEGTVFKLFKQIQGRIIFTTFSTTIARLQHVINACILTNRKLALVGRSMINNFNVCFQLGYIKVPEGMIVDITTIGDMPPERVCVLSTGSQGEDRAALSRMARDEHDLIQLKGGDAVIFSCKPIPGNEDSVQDLIARISRKGVDVFMNKEFDLHVSGHACVEDLKLLMNLTRPDYLMPIHGDHFMLRKVAELGVQMGIPFEHNLIVENNRITELTSDTIYVTDELAGGKVVLVDGTGVGAVSDVVLEERRQMATQGSLMVVMLVNKSKKLVGGPEIIGRGFVYMKNNTKLFDDMKIEIKAEFEKFKIDGNSESYWSDVRSKIRNVARDYIYNKTEKDPIIIPVVIQV